MRVDERLLTKYGPMTYPAMGGNRVVYAMPVPPTEDRGYLAPAKGDPLPNCGAGPAVVRRRSGTGYSTRRGPAMASNSDDADPRRPAPPGPATSTWRSHCPPMRRVWTVGRGAR